MRDYDEDAVFRAMERLDDRAEQAKTKTKQARRERQKKRRREQSVKQTDALRTDLPVQEIQSPDDASLLDDIDIGDIDLNAIETLGD